MKVRGDHPSPQFLQAVRYVGLVLIVGALLAQSYNGRQAVVDAARQSCRASSQRVAVIANVLRIDQLGNATIARDPGVALSARRVRARQAREEDRALRFLDLYIDQGALSKLNPVGQAIVRRLPHLYDCRRVFPDTPLFSFSR